MHPDHVAALVADQVNELEAALGGLELPVQSVELRESTVLLIRFTSRTTESITGLSGIPGVAEVPMLGTMTEEEFVLQLNCDDFDSQPPEALLLDADGSPLPPERWPHDKKGMGIVQGHPLYPDRKFFCRPGTREFHTHPQHEDQPWDEIREGRSIDKIALGILQDLRDRWTIR